MDQRFPPSDTGSCNTHAGYLAHERRNQLACDGCMTAHAHYTKASHIARGRSKGMLVSIDMLRTWLDEPSSVLADWLPDIVVYAIRHGRMPTQK